MGHSHHAHHDPNSDNYTSHIIRFRNVDFCTGCFGSKSFLIIILPILIRNFIYPNVLVSSTVDWTAIAILWILSLGSFSYEIFTGKMINNILAKIIVNLYIFGSIAYVILVPSTVYVGIARALIIVFALPQVALYVYKIVSRKEFHFKKLKFLARSLFIISFFFALVNFASDVYLNTIIVVIGVLLFSRLRTLSAYRVSNDEQKSFISPFPLDDKSMSAKFLSKLELFEEDGRLKQMNQFNSLLQKIYFLSLVAVFYLSGLVIPSTSLINFCAVESANSSVAASLASVPWIMMSSNDEIYCSTCGAANEAGSKFCASCGNLITQPSESQPQKQQPRPQPIQPQGYNQPPRGYQQQGYQQGYQQGPRGRYGHKNNSKRYPIILGVVVGIFAILLTGNIALGLLLGVIAYFGVMLAMSTNNPCLSYCIMSQVCDCICSMIGAENRRQGKF